MSTRSAWILGIAIGALLGALGTHLLSDGADTAPAPRPESRSGEPPPAQAEPALRGAAPAEPDPTQPGTGRTGALTTPTPGDVHVTEEAFLRAYREHFKQQTGSEPSAAQEAAAWEQFQRLTTSAAVGMANQAAQAVLADRRRAEITARDDIMTLLADSRRKDDIRALRNDPEAFARLLAHKSEGPQVDGPSVVATPPAEPHADGTVLYFPDGIHTLPEAALQRRGRVPRDLTIEGAGIDRTLIKLSDISTQDLVYNLHIKDCTIDCDNDGAFDLRQEKASVYAENVRFVRFDAGHGGCYIFAFSDGGAVYCKDCRFDGGYGRSPGSGNILRHVDVARFEDCVFERISYPMSSHNDAFFARCLFRDCSGMEATLKRALEHPSARGPRFEACRVETGAAQGADPRRRASLGRELRTLFPAFKER